MLAGVFERKLRSLNRGLRVFCGDDARRPAGLSFFNHFGEETEICGVDKNWVPEHTEFQEDGRIRKGGWRRVLKSLIGVKLVDRRHAERVFGVHLEYGNLTVHKMAADPIAKALQEARQRGYEKACRKAGRDLPTTEKGFPVNFMDVDDMIGIHRMREGK